MKASKLIRRALQLINVPGRGANLTAEDQTAAFETLQELLASESVSKMFVPGIRRHFFPMVSGKSIYSYGPSAQADLRSDDFDDDPAPIKIESAYIRKGTTITNNEQVDEYRFETQGTWTPAAGASIANNQLALAGLGSCVQSLAVPSTVLTYTVRLDVTVNAGDVKLTIADGSGTVLSVTIASTGVYEYDFVFGSTAAQTITLETTDASDDIAIASCSIIERGRERLELPDAQGSDYNMTIVDQALYNRRHTKGTGGRPYQLLYSRGDTISEIRFDNAALAGDILVMDVLVDRTTIAGLESEIRLNSNAIRWLRYKLADEMAGEYGKQLLPRQLTNMNEAHDRLVAGTWRMNTLGVDRGLRSRPVFDINRGDP